MAKNAKSKGMDTGTKVVIGLASLALLVFFANGNPDNDAWDDDSGDEVAATGGGVDPDGVELDLDEDADGESVDPPTDDPWTRGAPAGAEDGDDDDDDPEPPVDDPWTRGSPAGSSDDDDDEPAPPVDDPWTRGSDADGGFGDDGPAPCAGVTDFVTDEGRVDLPIDRADDAFASPDCTITEGQSGGPVWLVQAALAGCSGQPVSADGVAGPSLTQALAAVQAANGLTADGVYGPATREAMSWPTRLDDGGGTRCVAHPGVS
jgi:Putative peptidoglycan binding domain